MTITACFGLLYNTFTIAVSFTEVFQDYVRSNHIPYYYPVFYFMSGVCILCYLTIISSSIALARGSRAAARILGLILAFEVAYSFILHSLCGHPAIGTAVNASLGVANGGLSIQFVLLLPFVVPIALAVVGLYQQPETESGASDNQPAVGG